MKAVLRKAFNFSLAFLILVSEPYDITADKIFVKKIYIVSRQQHLGAVVAVYEKHFQKYDSNS